jgi:hypothetical protein
MHTGGAHGDRADGNVPRGPLVIGLIVVGLLMMPSAAGTLSVVAGCLVFVRLLTRGRRLAE